MTAGFDSLCDRSAPGREPTTDELWEAVMASASASKHGMTMSPAPDEPACPACEGGGWECYGIGRGDPHFRECQVCHNPNGLECP